VSITPAFTAIRTLSPRKSIIRVDARRVGSHGGAPTGIPALFTVTELIRRCRRRQSATERAHASLSRYFSPNLAERLAADADAIDLAGQRREIAALFTDIAGFTTLAETLEPNVLGPLLNEYLAGMTDIVFAHDGTLAKIIGDALHVLFGAPGEQPDHAARAIACALALDAHAQSFRERWGRKGIALGVTRIGAHAGPAIVGNFGGGRFFDTPPMATPSTLRRGWKPPTSGSAPASVSVRPSPRGCRIFGVVRSVIWRSEAEPTPCERSSRFASSNTKMPRREVTWRRSLGWKRMILL
jgi:class 3 adenylate cyclase